jgi:phosphohistidine phosphatase
VDLILWRHAEAEDGFEDEKRKLTAKGHKQAAKIAAWLTERLPKHVVVLVSPATRTQQTAMALSQKFTTSPDVGLSATPETLLKAAHWPRAGEPVVIVGHQPTLGLTAARLLAGRELEWSVRKGAIVWIVRKGSQNVLRACLSPELV